MSNSELISKYDKKYHIVLIDALSWLDKQEWAKDFSNFDRKQFCDSIIERTKV
jgi:hypothetical protein